MSTAHQSLPSFAQAFSTPSLSRISTATNALPPIRSRSPRPHSPPPTAKRSNSDGNTALIKRDSKKRTFPRDDDDYDSDASSEVRVKDEMEFDQLQSSPPPPNRQGRSHNQQQHQQSSSQPQPRARQQQQQQQQQVAAPPARAPKRRRITISGAHNPNPPVDLQSPNSSHSQQSSAPISPVVMGLPIQRDDPAAIEQVRAMITVKQRQKALIEQRRGSAAGLPLTPPNQAQTLASVSVVNSHGLSINIDQDERGHMKRAGRSPPVPGSSNSLSSSTRRGTLQSGPPPQQSTPDARPPSPPPHIVPSHTHAHVTHPPPIPSSLPLPPPPTSFARRRAMASSTSTSASSSTSTPRGRPRPADILISPRSPHHAHDQVQTIQSAPAVPRAGQAFGHAQQVLPGRGGFPGPGQITSLGPTNMMALPTLPSLGGGAKRVTAGQVPPTPTRLSMQRGSVSHAPPGPSGPGPGPAVGVGTRLGRSPPTASVAIASTLVAVPPTPSTLQHRYAPSTGPGGPGANPNHAAMSADKASFLAPFEMFYDALADAKQLKNWLGEQLARSARLEERLEEIVERRVVGMREEVGGLKKRVEHLEEALARERSGAGGMGKGKQVQVVDMSPSLGQGQGQARIGSVQTNGPTTTTTPSLGPSDLYTFPPVDAPNIRPTSILRTSDLSSPEHQPLHTTSPTLANVNLSQKPAISSRSPPAHSHSPVPLSEPGRRLSVSAMRFEPAPPPRWHEREKESRLSLGQTVMRGPSPLSGVSVNATSPQTEQSNAVTAAVPVTKGGSGDLLEGDRKDENKFPKSSAMAPVADGPKDGHPVTSERPPASESESQSRRGSVVPGSAMTPPSARMEET